MFRWAASLSTKLTETFAPLFRTNLEQLQDAWKKVDADCRAIISGDADTTLENMDDPQRLIDSPLVTHLNQLVEALVKEEEQQAEQLARNAGRDDSSDSADSTSGSKESGKSSTGPCFEYFLNEKILDRLCALGLPDRPLGMRQLITKTLDAVLTNTRHPILPSMSVHGPVRQFLEVCFTREDHKRRGYKLAYLSLLCTIAKKIKTDNSLAGIFFDIYPGSKEKRNPEFLLFSVLCTMMSENVAEGRNAYEALLWLVQLPNPDITAFVLVHSPYLTRTIDSLTHLFSALPPPVECPLIDELMLAQQTYPALDQFFKRWAYCDAIMRSTYAEVQAALGAQLRSRFLDGLIGPLLLDNRENVAMWTTNFLKHLALTTTSPALRRVLVEFLLGTDTNPERPPAEGNHAAATADSSPSTATPAASSSPSSLPSTAIRSILLKRLDSLSDSLCIHTLDLLQTLIGLRDPLVLHNLMLRNLQPRTGLTIDATGGDVASSPSHLLSGGDVLPIQQSIMFAGFHDLPDFASRPNFEDYLLDAQLEGQLWMQAWEDVFQRAADLRALEMDQSVDALMESAASTTPPPSDLPAPSSALPFYEGLFFATICNKLESLYENSFATNLKLSGVLSKLSYCPSPVLHDFLFGSVVPNSGSPAAVGGAENEPRLLLQVLASVWNKGVKRASRMPNFARRKEDARQRLNQQINQTYTPMQSSVSVETMEGERFFRGLILLEELLQELHSIAQTKARLFALQKLARLQASVTATQTRRTLAAADGEQQPQPSPASSECEQPTPVASDSGEDPACSPSAEELP